MNNINSKHSVTNICSQDKSYGENKILYLLMIHFSALSMSISRTISITWKHDLWMLTWKMEGNSHGMIATWLAIALTDWGQSQKSQFTIILTLPETSTQVPPDYKPQALQVIKLDWFICSKLHHCHYSESLVTKKVLKHPIISKCKISSVCGLLQDTAGIRIV
jgi:hypothetical protein